MKKTRLLTICTLALALVCLLLAGCSKEEKIASVGLKDHDPDTVIEVPMGDFDYSVHTLVVTYDSGKIEQIPLTEQMIGGEETFKFYKEGEHELTISYGGKECVVRILVKRGILGEVSFPSDNVFVYDGQPHTVEVVGDLPANAVVTYPGGNSFVNAGNYDVTAVVACEGYVTKTLKTTVTIERAAYDMQGVVLESKETVYNGSPHTLLISGTLPNGVAVPTYYINEKRGSSATDAGEYTVRAVFDNTNPNYEPIPEMRATLVILPAEYDAPEIDVVFTDGNGVVIEGGETVYDSQSVTFDIAGESIPRRITVSFAVLNENGDVISNSKNHTNMINVGVYTVRVNLTLDDRNNYKPIDPVERTFEITKASYDTSKIFLDSDIVSYDGEMHRLQVDVPAELGFAPQDITYDYYLDGKLVQSGLDAGVTEVGQYTVVARFATIDENYEPIPDIDASLVIEPGRIDVSTLGFDDETEFFYNGESHTVAFNGLPKENLVYSTALYVIDGEEMTEVTEAIEIGTYRCVVTVSAESSNYILSTGETSRKYTCDFTVIAV